MTTAKWGVLHALDRHGDAWRSEIVEKVKEAGCGDIGTKNPFTDLVKAGFIRKTQYGRYSITDDGRRALRRLFHRVFPLVIRIVGELERGATETADVEQREHGRVPSAGGMGAE